MGVVQRPVSRRRNDEWCFGFSGGGLSGLVIGVIVIIVGVASVFGRVFSAMMGRWGENFGEGMSRWAESFGEGMGRWGESVGRFFVDWGMGWGSKIGASFLIIVGLVIVYFVVYEQNRR